MSTYKETTNSEGRKTYTISIGKANRIALLMIIPIVALMAVPYYLIWGVNILDQLHFQSLGLLVVFIVGGVAIHELLHGITWAVFARNGFRSIRFGIKWEYLTPYCHCTEALKVWQYIVGGLMPLLVMGLLPSAWAMLNGNALVMFYGIFFTVAAGGDIQSVWLLRRFKSSQLIYDHPEELGFVIDNENS